MFEPILFIVDYITMFFNGLGQFSTMSFADMLNFFNGDIVIELNTNLTDSTTIDFSMFNFNDFPLIGSSLQSYVNSFFVAVFYPINGDITTPFYICCIFGLLRVFLVLCVVDIMFKILGLALDIIDIVLPT